MADAIATIEGQALRLMQAWMHRDAGTLRNIMMRDCMFMFGTNPPQLLDRPSILAALENGLVCTGFRLGEAAISKHGRSVWWTAGAELELKLGAIEWSGSFLITDLWHKTRFGGWKLAERSLSPTDKDADHRLSNSIRQLQLWR